MPPKQPSPLETDLYPPIKAFLEGQGYAVKGEVNGCDVVAVRAKEPPVIVELKQRFSLDLVLQAVERQALSDAVYVAVPDAGGMAATVNRKRRAVLKLCRRLGLGLLVVTPGRDDALAVEPRLDPAPYKPRQDKARRRRLLREFAHRVGDPTQGGGNGRAVMTAYRQDALRCADRLAAEGLMKPSKLRDATGVWRAARILRDDVYGWFDHPAKGLYALSPKGAAALEAFADTVLALREGAGHFLENQASPGGQDMTSSTSKIP
jgi:hypothetical protein